MNKNTITENPFYKFGVTPTDDKETLLALSDEAAFLDMDNAEEAAASLLNPRSRLEAEMNWFPGLPQETVNAILEYPEKDTVEPYPVVESSVLALFNAVQIFLSGWDMSQMQSAGALLTSFARIDSALDAEEITRDINKDREQAGIRPISDPADVETRLRECRKSAAADLMDRLSRGRDKNGLASMMKYAADLALGNDSPLMEMLAETFTLDNSGDAEKKYEYLLAKTGILTNSFTADERRNLTRDIVSGLDDWHRLTLPSRTLLNAKGNFSDQERKLLHDIRDAAIDIINRYHQIDEGEKLLKKLSEVFSSMPAAKDRLKEDLSAINKLRLIAGVRRF